jgi:hypothetical protein
LEVYHGWTHYAHVFGISMLCPIRPFVNRANLVGDIKET